MGGRKSASKWGWYYGWNIVAVSVLSRAAANGLPSNSVTLFLRDWSVELNSPISQLQLPGALMVVIAALIAPLIGTLADKQPARLLFGAGLAGMAVFCLAISWVTATWQILLLYATVAPVALGLCTGITGSALVSRWFERRAGLALGFCASGTAIAGVFLPPIIGWLLPLVGWRMIWRAGGLIIFFVVLPIVVAIIRQRPTEREGLQYVGGAATVAVSGGDQVDTAPQVTSRGILMRGRFWLLVAIYLPMLSLYMGFQQNLAPYATAHGMGPASAGVLVSIISVSQILGALALGWVADRFGHRAPFVGLAVALIVGASLVAIGSGWPMIVAGTILIGLGGGVLALLTAAIVAEFGAKAVGRAFGLCMFFLPLAAFAGFFIAKGQEITGSYAPVLAGMAGVIAVSGALSLLLRARVAR